MNFSEQGAINRGHYIKMHAFSLLIAVCLSVNRVKILGSITSRHSGKLPWSRVRLEATAGNRAFEPSQIRARVKCPSHCLAVFDFVMQWLSTLTLFDCEFYSISSFFYVTRTFDSDLTSCVFGKVAHSKSAYNDCAIKSKTSLGV
jgi:hypothetical protein